ncbi:MAG: hypothetical protein ACOCZH_05290 [Phototrophicaceae bacterium]
MPSATPDTLNYLIMGLAVTFIVLTLLMGSMVIRHRNLSRDAELIERLQADD